jgi:hypothetical protein
MWGWNLERMMIDYLKFKGITGVGLLLYPILAPAFILYMFGVIVGYYYEMLIDKIKVR